MAAPPATTSSALAHLVHRQWFIMHPWTRVDRWGTGGTGGDASRRYLYTPVSITQADSECRLEGDKTHEIFHFLSKKVGGGTFPMWSPPSWKVGGTRPPPRPPPIYARDGRACFLSWNYLYGGYFVLQLFLALSPSLPFSLSPCVWRHFANGYHVGLLLSIFWKFGYNLTTIDLRQLHPLMKYVKYVISHMPIPLV